MRNLLAFFAAALLVFAGLGYYLDWYKVDRVPTATGHQQLSIDIDGKKISADVIRGTERGAEKVEKILEGRRPAEPASQAATAAGGPSQRPASQ
jgi:hypothetical protein